MKRFIYVLLSSLFLSSCVTTTPIDDVIPPHEDEPSEGEGEGEKEPEQKKALTSISLSGTYKTTFYVEEAFSYAGLVVTATFDDNSTSVVTDYNVSSPNMYSVGKQDVTISYTYETVTKRASYEIEIVPQEVTIKSVFTEPYISRMSYLNQIGDIFSVWEEYRGRGVKVAIIDKAFHAYHEDFYDENNNLAVSSLSASFTNNNGTVTKRVGVNEVNDLSDSHGTFCAGIVGARHNNKGVIGIAPECEMILLKVDGKPKSIAEAFKYAADIGVRVITISIGSYYNYEGDLINDGSDLGDVFDESLLYCHNKGVVVCSAAGNGGPNYSTATDYTFPGACDYVIGAGGLAYNSVTKIWEGSSYNSSKQYQFVDVFAPSEMMYGCSNYEENGTYYTYDGGWRGTSFASPIVAGLAALYFEKYPTYTVSQFEQALYASCVKLTDNSIVSNPSEQLGYGRVDVGRLMSITSPTTVEIKVKSSWSNVYLYAFGDNKEIANWPGVKLTKQGDYYSYNINTSTYPFVIFSNGSGTQTFNIASVSFIDSPIYDITSPYAYPRDTGHYVGKYIPKA